MEQRLAQALQRLGQADRALRDRGRDPEPFILIYAVTGPVKMAHSGWDSSWSLPTAEDIDDLAELEYVRVQPGEAKRVFSLTVKGRQQAAALAEPSRRYVGGRAPALDEVLDWLIQQEQETPEAFDLPTRLLDNAVSSGFIQQAGRGDLASKLVALFEQGYLSGDLFELEQADAEDRLGLPGSALKLTMKAHDRTRADQAATGSPAIAFYGSVAANQIAAGNITNYVSFGALLNAAEAELRQLDDVDDQDLEEAHHLLDALRGKTVDASIQLATGAGGGLLAAVIARLLGLPL
jgi:hypothetical protein